MCATGIGLLLVLRYTDPYVSDLVLVDLGEARVDIELFLVAVGTMASAPTHEDVEEAAVRLRSLLDRAISARHRLVESERGGLYGTPSIGGRPSWVRLGGQR